MCHFVKHFELHELYEKCYVNKALLLYLWAVFNILGCFAHACTPKIKEHIGEKGNRKWRKTRFSLGFGHLNNRHVLGSPFCAATASCGLQGKAKEMKPSQTLHSTNNRQLQKWDWFASSGCNLRFRHKHGHFQCNSERLCCLKRNEIMNKNEVLSESYAD